MNIADPDRLVAEQTDQEMTLVLDLQTIRLLQHQPGAVLVQCDVVGLDRTPVVQSPRAILMQQLKIAEGRGYHVLASTELEFMSRCFPTVSMTQNCSTILTPAATRCCQW